MSQHGSLELSELIVRVQSGQVELLGDVLQHYESYMKLLAQV